MYRTGSWKHQIFLIGGDAAILLGAFHLALQYWWWKIGPYEGDFFPAALVSLGMYLLTLSMFDLYDIQKNYRSQQASTLTHILGAVVMAGVGLSGLFYLMPGVKLPRSSFFIQMGLAIPLLYLWRINFWRLRQEMLIPKRVLIVGTGEDGQTALDLLKRFGTEYHVVGFIDDDPDRQARTIGGHAVLGGADALPELVQEHDVQGIIMALAKAEGERLIRATLQCRMKGVFVSDLVTVSEQVAGKILLTQVRDSWFVYAPGFLLLHGRMFRRIKRITDVACAGVGLVLASPLLVMAAILVAAESRGPVFFRQTRVGQNERLFSALKFRTMKGGDETQSPYTAKNDPRVTLMGMVLRFLRIDEIPQMWNVLTGEMSFVGPRAEWNLLLILLHQNVPFRSRTDETHLPLEHIPHLRNLINA